MGNRELDMCTHSAILELVASRQCVSAVASRGILIELAAFILGDGGHEKEGVLLHRRL